jgi:hypothetical protein
LPTEPLPSGAGEVPKGEGAGPRRQLRASTLASHYSTPIAHGGRVGRETVGITGGEDHEGGDEKKCGGTNASSSRLHAGEWVVVQTLGEDSKS